MTPEVYEYVKKAGLKGFCLDVGSYNVNGCVRDLFELYVGLDMRKGPNVDFVCSSHAIPYPENVFDVVTCLEMLEHDDDPFKTISEMARVLRPGGMMVITVPSISFPRHDYPSDYWRFTGDGVKVLLRNLEVLNVVETSDHVFATARKRK